jgi:hypothetical protein
MNQVAEISIDGLEAWADVLAAAKDETLERMLPPAHEATFLMEREVTENTPVGAGGAAGLRGSYHSRVITRGVSAIEGRTASALAYATPVELGTKPHFPPIQPLEDWVTAKLGISGDEARSVAFAVAKKIAREGTKGAFMFKRAFEENQDQARAIFERHLAAFIDELGGRA